MSPELVDLLCQAYELVCDFLEERGVVLPGQDDQILDALAQARANESEDASTIANRSIVLLLMKATSPTVH